MGIIPPEIEAEIDFSGNLPLARDSFHPLYKPIMGQQLRKIAKRRRRIAYNERKKEAAKLAAISKPKK